MTTTRRNGLIALLTGVLLAVVAGGVVLVRSGDQEQRARAGGATVEGLVGEAGLELIHPEGAELSIPAGALPTGTEVKLAKTRPDNLAQLGALQPDGTAWGITADAEPTRPVRLTVPYDPAKVPAKANSLVVTFDELTGWWLPVETSADPAEKRLTASLPSFSVKTWIVDRIDDAAGPASWLEYQSWKLFGNRADKPDCSAAPKPDWVTEVLTVPDDNAQLFACVGREGDGFALNVVNNRGYPVSLELDRPFTAAVPSRLEDGLAGLAASLFAAAGQQRVLLMPTGSATISYNPVATADGRLEGYVRRDAVALLMYLAMELAREAGVDLPLANGKKLGLWTLECFGRMFSATGQVLSADVISAGNQLTGCLDDTLTHEARLWGFDPDDNNGQRLWSKDADKLPTGAKNAIKALRVLRALDIAKWLQTAADMFIVDNNPSADLIDVAVGWKQAPKWGAGGEGGVYLYTLPAVANAVGSNTGQLVPAQLGGRSYPQSTGAWLGCVDPATLTYQLDGGYKRLKSTVGLAPHTPAGLAARIAITADGKALASVDVTPDRTAPIDVDLSGVRQLVVSVLRTEGTCEDSTVPYGVLGDAYLIPGQNTSLSALPATFLGTWRGQMTQPTSARSPYSMEVIFTNGATGTKVGTVAYADLSCGGDLTLVRAEAGRIVVAEQITYGTGCILAGQLEVRPTADGKLYFAYRPATDLAGAPLAWATLSKG